MVYGRFSAAPVADLDAFSAGRFRMHGLSGVDVKRKVFEQYHRGESVASLAGRFHRGQTGIRRIIKEMRTGQVQELPLDYMPNAQFAEARDPAVEREILGPMPSNEVSWKQPRPPRGLPPYLASLYEIPLLTRQQEMHLFRKMNYLKYKASKLRGRLDPASPRLVLIRQIEKCYDEAVAVKNQIIRANLRLVVAIAKRHVGLADRFFDLVSDGNMSLMRAVEKFDFARGNKFSTYATWAIMKNFARTIPEGRRYRSRYQTSQAERFVSTADDHPDPAEQEASQHRRKAEVEKVLECLDPREQEIIVRRFGLGRGREPLTLKQVGAELGVTKERIRQIQARALSKLRKAAQQERVDFPA